MRPSTAANPDRELLRQVGQVAAAMPARDWSSPAMAVVAVLLMEFGDFAMMRRMLLGLKERAEAVAASQAGVP